MRSRVGELASLVHLLRYLMCCHFPLAWLRSLGLSLNCDDKFKARGGRRGNCSSLWQQYGIRCWMTHYERIGANCEYGLGLDSKKEALSLLGGTVSRDTTIWITDYSNVKHYFLFFLRAAYWDGRLRMFIVSSSHFFPFPFPPSPYPLRTGPSCRGVSWGGERDDTKCIMVACETWGGKVERVPGGFESSFSL